MGILLLVRSNIQMIDIHKVSGIKPINKGKDPAVPDVLARHFHSQRD
jgi:hypothetical protein